MALMQFFGRNSDIDLFCKFVDEALARSGALLVNGDAGVGRPALLDRGALHAEVAETRAWGPGH
jgi:hypothetical protein